MLPSDSQQAPHLCVGTALLLGWRAPIFQPASSHAGPPCQTMMPFRQWCGSMAVRFRQSHRRHAVAIGLNDDVVTL